MEQHLPNTNKSAESNLPIEKTKRKIKIEIKELKTQNFQLFFQYFQKLLPTFIKLASELIKLLPKFIKLPQELMKLSTSFLKLMQEFLKLASELIKLSWELIKLLSAYIKFASEFIILISETKN